jgi:hypothetical protein
MKQKWIAGLIGLSVRKLGSGQGVGSESGAGLLGAPWSNFYHVFCLVVIVTRQLSLSAWRRQKHSRSSILSVALDAG